MWHTTLQHAQIIWESRPLCRRVPANSLELRREGAPMPQLVHAIRSVGRRMVVPLDNILASRKGSATQTQRRWKRYPHVSHLCHLSTSQLTVADYTSCSKSTVDDARTYLCRLQAEYHHIYLSPNAWSTWCCRFAVSTHTHVVHSPPLDRTARASMGTDTQDGRARLSCISQTELVDTAAV